MDIMNKAYIGFIISIILYFIEDSTKYVITINPFNPVDVNIYLLYLFRIGWYVIILSFLQSSLIIINGKYIEKEQTRLFYVQILLIILSEFGSYSQILYTLWVTLSSTL